MRDATAIAGVIAVEVAEMTDLVTDGTVEAEEIVETEVADLEAILRAARPSTA